MMKRPPAGTRGFTPSAVARPLFKAGGLEADDGAEVVYVDPEGLALRPGIT